MARLTVRKKRARIGKAALGLANLLRRMSFTSASALEWILEGFQDSEGNTETEEAEVFGVGGFASVPEDEARAEAMVAYIGGDQNAPVVLATRDADAAKAFEARAGDLEAGETAVFAQNGAFIKITADGDIILRAKAGREVLIDDGSGAVALAKGDHTHGPGTFAAGGDAVTGVSGGSSSNTTIVKGK